MSRDAITEIEQARQTRQIEQTLEEASWDIPRLLKINARLVKEKHEQAEQIAKLQAELAGALAEIVTANDISVSVARLKADNTMLVEQCCDKTHALDVSVHNAELAKKAIEQKHERVRYFENRNTQLATENMNQAEQIGRLTEAMTEIANLVPMSNGLFGSEAVRLAQKAMKGVK